MKAIKALGAAALTAVILAPSAFATRTRAIVESDSAGAAVTATQEPAPEVMTFWQHLLAVFGLG